MIIELVMFKDGGQRKEFSLEVGQTVIGRGEECDLRIPLPEISRKHAVMIVSAKEATVRDMSSANGTYVNNRKVSEQELSAGDHIVIGPVVFTVRIDGVPGEVRPVHTRLEARPPTDAEPTPASAKKPEPAAAPATDEELFGDDEEDPISALEALAATDDTTAIDLGGSAFGDEEDDETV